MKFPRMILFDYGDTLLYEPDIDLLRGEEALFQYVKSNKNGVSAAEACAFSLKLIADIRALRGSGLEIHEWQFLRLLYEHLEIELSISYPEAEKVFFDNSHTGAVMPGADILLDYINTRGIRSGVISNIMFSGAALRDRIDRLLPGNRFEFIITSSEYVFRKPSRYLFELALKKAELDASEVWFCGDNIEADIEGAAAAGIFPVWYQNLTVDNPYRIDYGGKVPQCDHLHIHEWDELHEVLEGLQ